MVPLENLSECGIALTNDYSLYPGPDNHDADFTHCHYVTISQRIDDVNQSINGYES